MASERGRAFMVCSRLSPFQHLSCTNHDTVCGPPGMKVDVANAVAEMQADIWKSDEREEVYLHTESFGW